MNYAQYIQSGAWREKSKATIAERGGVCELCGRADMLGVHHISYERMGEETEADLEVLCVCCHAISHLVEGDVAYGRIRYMISKLIRHGHISCVAAVRPIKDASRSEPEQKIIGQHVVYCVAGARHRKQVVTVIQHFDGAKQETIFVDLLDLFSADDRYKLRDTTFLGPFHLEGEAIEPMLLDVVARLPVVDRWVAEREFDVRPDVVPPAVSADTNQEAGR